eukprot:2280451-Prymnesium_polylepis.2
MGHLAGAQHLYSPQGPRMAAHIGGGALQGRWELESSERHLWQRERGQYATSTTPGDQAPAGSATLRVRSARTRRGLRREH